MIQIEYLRGVAVLHDLKITENEISSSVEDSEENLLLRAKKLWFFGCWCILFIELFVKDWVTSNEVF